MTSLHLQAALQAHRGHGQGGAQVTVMLPCQQGLFEDDHHLDLIKLMIETAISNDVISEQSPRAMMVPDSDPRPAKKRSQSSVCELTNLRR